jgi:hypothetical protein
MNRFASEDAARAVVGSPDDPSGEPADPVFRLPDRRSAPVPARRARTGEAAGGLVRRRLADPRWQDRLADALVAGLFERRLDALCDPVLIAQGTREVLQRVARSDAFEARFALAVGDLLAFLDAHRGPVGELLPEELRDGLAELARRPLAPAPELVLRLVGHPPVRAAVRELVVEILRGLGAVGEPGTAPGKARRRDAFTRRARASMENGRLGRLALGVAGAVSDEVERSVERRARELVDGAMTMVLGKIAAHLGRGRSPQERDALQLGLLDAGLALPGTMVAREVAAVDLPEGYRVVVAALDRWLADEASETALAALVDGLLAREGHLPVGVLLDDLGLREPVERLARETLRREIAALLPGEAFSVFLDDLLDPEEPL